MRPGLPRYACCARINTRNRSTQPPPSRLVTCRRPAPAYRRRHPMKLVGGCARPRRGINGELVNLPPPLTTLHLPRAAPLFSVDQHRRAPHQAAEAKSPRERGRQSGEESGGKWGGGRCQDREQRVLIGGGVGTYSFLS